MQLRSIYYFRPSCALILLAGAATVAGLSGCDSSATDPPGTAGSSSAVPSDATPADGESGGPSRESADTDTSEPEEADAAKITATLIDYEGLQQVIKELQGKVVVVDVWSNACLPCLKEFPNLVALSKEFPDQVACISINVDYIGLKQKPAASFIPRVEAFVRKQGADFRNYVSSERDEDLLEKFEAESIPAILIYDQHGQLAQRFTDDNAGDDGLSYAGDVVPKVRELIGQGE